MRQSQRKAIGQIAEEIKKQLELNSPPYDIEAVIKSIGGIIYEDSSFEFDSDATIERKDDGFLITINKNQNPQRKRFTLAHELGHLFLHMGFGIDEDEWRSSKKYEDTVIARSGVGTKEYEANEFAAAFLMPEDEFKQQVKDNDAGDKVRIKPIADYFNVSPDAVRNRGRWLGLFSWN